MKPSLLATRGVWSALALLTWGCLNLPGASLVFPDTVHTETIVTTGIDRDGQPVDSIQEIPEGRSWFIVHSRLSDLRPGKEYLYRVQIADQFGEPLIELGHGTRRFTADEGEVEIWRRVSPNWDVHGPGLWEISSGIDGQETLTELYVVPRFAQKKGDWSAPARSTSRVWFHLGIASHVTPGERPRPVNDLDKVARDRDRIHVYVQLHGLEEGREYTCTYRVTDRGGDPVLTESRTFTAEATTWILTSELRLPRFFRAGIWQIEASAEDRRARRRFEVE